jgi:hypothetical protein
MLREAVYQDFQLLPSGVANRHSDVDRRFASVVVSL